MSERVAAIVQALRTAMVAAGLERRERNGLVYFAGGAAAASAPAMVLVHGANDHAGTWAAVVPFLVSKFRLLVPDLAGHGESAPASGPIEVESIQRGLEEVIDHEIGGPFTLVGNSMGAWMSILYALRHGPRLSRLVLESGGGLARPLGVQLIARTPDEAVRILHAVHGPHADTPEWAVEALLRRADSSPLVRMIEGGAFQHLVDDRLAGVDVPTTIVWGAHDGVVPRDYVDALREGIRGARLQVVDGAAHIPHMQQPERFVACLNSIS